LASPTAPTISSKRFYKIVFFQAYLLKYEDIALVNLSNPILNKSYLIVAAPFEYVIPSKIVVAA